MVAWVNTPASLSLDYELDAAFPDRDKRSDGSIGDAAHQAEPSDHNPDETGNTGRAGDADHRNEVHARDVDADLRRPGWTMEMVVQIILARCRAGLEKRLRYIIFNRRIWEADNGWRERAYHGPSPHDEHVHFSFRYGSGSGPSNPENITTAWGILAAVNSATAPGEEDDMAFTEAQLKTIFKGAMVELFVAGTHAAESDAEYAKMDESEKKLARAARDFILKPIAEQVADRLRVGDKGFADKLADDLKNAGSGVALGMKKIAEQAVADAFANEALAAKRDALGQ